MKSKYDYLFIIIITFLVMSYTYSKISYSLDLLGYVGVVNEYDSNNKLEAHHKTFATLKNLINEGHYNSDSAKYINALDGDHKSYLEKLSFFRIRPIYTGLIFCFTKVGIPIGFAIKTITILPILFLLITLYFVVKKETNNVFIAFGFSLLILFSPLVISPILGTLKSRVFC